MKIALSTLLRLCKWASVYERCLSCRVRRCNGYVLAPTTPPPPIPSTPQAPEVRFVVDQRFQTKWMNEKNITTYFILNLTDCVVNYCSSILFNCHYYQKKYTRDNTIPTINLNYKNLSLGLCVICSIFFVFLSLFRIFTKWTNHRCNRSRHCSLSEAVSITQIKPKDQRQPWTTTLFFYQL